MAKYLLTETVTTTFECEAKSRIDALNQLFYAKQGDRTGISVSGVEVEWHDEQLPGMSI